MVGGLPAADLDAEELERDGTALGGLSEPDLGPEKKSRLYEYSFPVQDTKLSTGEALDVDTAKKVGRSSSSTRRPGGWC